MSEALFKNQPKTSEYKRHPRDWYVEPEWVVELLLKTERFAGTVIDPCAGMNTIPKVCLRNGVDCRGFDISPHSRAVNHQDFLDPDYLPVKSNNIIFNPPYAAAQLFVERALAVTDCKVAAILPLSFICGQKRAPWLYDQSPLARVYPCIRRPSMPPGEVVISGGKVGGGKVNYAWFVWEHGYRGSVQMMPLEVSS